jgi:exodeoxyribonuclease V alpha subunit
MSTLTKSHLNELLAKLKAEREANSEADKAPESKSSPNSLASNQVVDKYGKLITLNSQQSRFVQLAGHEGQSAVLIGPAGTGKTTTQYAVTQELIQSGLAGVLSADGHKHLKTGSPGIVVCAYTRRAVANIRRNLPLDLQDNAITIHKLLEYEPVYYEVEDPETGSTKSKMSFEPTRTRDSPIPSSVRVVIIEESSMLSVDLYKRLADACPHRPQFIFLGDIQQLPPIFGPAILGFKILSLPHVELTEVYRQALESPIIALAHRILSGKTIDQVELPNWNKPGQLTIKPWKKKISAENALLTAAAFFKQAETLGVYNPDEDTILIPFNKAFGTDELNKHVANHLARKRNSVTYEIIAGFQKHYFSVGDRVMYDKEDAEIIEIARNPNYFGAEPKVESDTLDYWGQHQGEVHKTDFSEDEAMDFLLAATAASGEDKVRQCSHTIKLRMLNTDSVVTIDKAGDCNLLALGYALTVHKSQGSEWRKVFLCIHQSHATMTSRELLYTAVTRAREELYIICEPDTLVKGINSQRVKGDTLEEKAEHFKGKIEEGYVVNF